MLIEKKAEEITEKHTTFLEKHFKDSKKFKKFLFDLYRTDDDKLSAEELAFKKEGKTMEELYDDLSDLMDKHEKEIDLNLMTLDMPVFVARHPVLRKFWEDTHRDLVLPSFDIKDVV